MSANVCGDCRTLATERPWLLRGLGHDDCITALRAENLAKRTFWVRISPEGCVTGSSLGHAGQLIDDVHKQFTPRIRDRRKEAAEGWRHELVTHAEWKKRAEACLLGRCEHRTAVTA